MHTCIYVVGYHTELHFSLFFCHVNKNFVIGLDSCDHIIIGKYIMMLEITENYFSLHSILFLHVHMS